MNTSSVRISTQDDVILTIGRLPMHGEISIAKFTAL